MRLWEKHSMPDPDIERFTVGDDPDLDMVLIPYDCQASIVHASMLFKQGFLDEHEFSDISQALEIIREDWEKGRFEIRRDQEDGHTAIEEYLHLHCGDAGKKIHTGRSRNDQVLTALRLFEKDKLNDIIADVKSLQNHFRLFAEQYAGVSSPGYTHMRKAMPSSLASWALTYAGALGDDLDLLKSVRGIIDQSPLGTGAGYGVPVNTMQEFTSKAMGFSRYMDPPGLAQHSRGKFESMVLYAMLQLMYDLNKWASDLIMFSMPEIGFMKLPDAFTTGSSIMPHKKNPDVLELIRAKYHILSSLEMQSRALQLNLIGGYHRDLQLGKEAIIKGLSLVRETIQVSAMVMKSLDIDIKAVKNIMTDELYATEKVYEMVKNGIPFRDAYQKCK